MILYQSLVAIGGGSLLSFSPSFCICSEVAESEIDGFAEDFCSEIFEL
jgi:hypothetical protein